MSNKKAPDYRAPNLPPQRERRVPSLKHIIVRQIDEKYEKVTL